MVNAFSINFRHKPHSLIRLIWWILHLSYWYKAKIYYYALDALGRLYARGLFRNCKSYILSISLTPFGIRYMDDAELGALILAIKLTYKLKWWRYMWLLLDQISKGFTLIFCEENGYADWLTWYFRKIGFVAREIVSIKLYVKKKLK